MKKWHRYRVGSLLLQRGLSLVEIMIILVVVGLLLGASVVPFSSLWKEDAYTREREKMAVLQEAIIGYAASHRTKEQIVRVSDGGLNPRVFTLPAGRPYLPCPDITGDGYENRAGYDPTGEVALVPTLTVYIVGLTPADNPLLERGNCVATRGALPWKTLGTPPADYWGSRYTYQVDDIFSNAFIGFNQDTAIDSFDYRQPIEIDVNGDIQYRHRAPSEPLLVFINSRRPIVVCDGGRVTLCQGSGGALPLEAGRLATVAFEAPRRSYAAGDVIEGLPYVIVSHGDNRYGAVNHAANFEDNFGTGLACNWPINGSSAFEIPDYLRHEAVNFPLVETTSVPAASRSCSPVTYGGGTPINNGFFVTQPRAQPFPFINSDSGDTFDDIVVWQTRQELTRYFTDAGILPAENFPVLRPY